MKFLMTVALLMSFTADLAAQVTHRFSRDRPVSAVVHSFASDHPALTSPIRAAKSAALKTLNVLFFHAPWCAPCRQMEPFIGSMPFQVTDINGDVNPAIVQRYRVTAYPTLVATIGGKEVDRRVGFATKEAVSQWVENIRQRRQQARKPDQTYSGYPVDRLQYRVRLDST